MKKWILWSGVGTFILGAFLFFVSGSTSGPELKPTIPFLYGTNQFYWMLLAFTGVVITVVGAFLKGKKRR